MGWDEYDTIESDGTWKQKVEILITGLAIVVTFGLIAALVGMAAIATVETMLKDPLLFGAIVVALAVLGGSSWIVGTVFSHKEKSLVPETVQSFVRTVRDWIGGDA